MNPSDMESDVHPDRHAPAAEPIRILIVEDDPVDAELTERALKKAQLRFVARLVSDEAAFLRELGEWKPEVVCADYSIPGFGGLAAVSIARDVAPQTPVIIVSGSIGEEQAIETLKQGATDYVLKNRLSRLAHCVDRAIREAAEHAERKKSEVALRTKVEELIEANRRLENFNRQMVGREGRMIELKREINTLSIELGRGAPYDLSALVAESPDPARRD